MRPMRIFVTGTDTGIGKTVVSTIFCRGLGAHYWKPVQSGAQDGTDSQFLSQWGVSVHPEAYSLAAPLSPHTAAEMEGKEILLPKILSSVPKTESALVAEGAGGVLVPLNERYLMVDLMATLKWPTLIVTRSTLGTINHTLLTVEALRRRSVPILGAVMVGTRNVANQKALETYGAIPVLGNIDFTAEFTTPWMKEQFQKLDFRRPHVARQSGRLLNFDS